MWGLQLSNESGDDFGIIATWSERPSVQQIQSAVFDASPCDCVTADGDSASCFEDVEWDESYLDWELYELPEPDQY